MSAIQQVAQHGVHAVHLDLSDPILCRPQHIWSALANEGLWPFGFKQSRTVDACKGSSRGQDFDSTVDNTLQHLCVTRQNLLECAAAMLS